MADPDRVPNRDSTARDHLANERTFLAWVRTGLGMMGLGVVFEKFVADRHDRYVEWVAIFLIAAGAVLTLYAVYRYERVCSALRNNEFLIARRSPIVLGVGTVLLGLGLSAWLLSRP